ncbi:MAG: type II toxin-antitoxin system ParD family antitoxin [Methylophaga sp.]|nr:MAG: type II toxin-antitoxin system ParD family antitoxin [Methylophaga sp.]
MNLSLTPQLEQFIRERAESGDYNNASEVVREAIRVFKRTEEESALKLKQLRAAVQVGDEAIAGGDSISFRSDKELAEFFDRL